MSNTAGIAAAQIFAKITLTMKRMLRFLGVDFYDPNFKFNFGTIFSQFIMIAFFIMFFYSIYLNYRDFIYLSKVVVVLGVSVQLMIKMFVALLNAKSLRDAWNLIGTDIYDRYQNGNYDQTRILRICAGRSYLFMIILSILYILSGLMFSIYPVYMYVFEGVLEPIYLLLLPGIDSSKNPGYFYTMVLQYIITLWGVLGCIASDVIFLVYVMHYTAYSNLLKNHLKDLGGYLKDRDTYLDLERDEAFVKSEVREIYKDHQRMINFLDAVTDVYTSLNLSQVIVCCLSLVLAAFIAVTTQWYAVYGFFMALYGQLFVYCAFGTVVELTNDAMLAEIYHFPWHLLRIEDQKNYIFMLQKSQEAQTLTAGGLVPLNIELFVDISKTFYQILMMMLNFIN